MLFVVFLPAELSPFLRLGLAAVWQLRAWGWGRNRLTFLSTLKHLKQEWVSDCHVCHLPSAPATQTQALIESPSGHCS